MPPPVFESSQPQQPAQVPPGLPGVQQPPPLPPPLADLPEVVDVDETPGSAFAWGIIGQNRYDVLTGHGSFGIIRTDVESGVEYARPPFAGDNPAWDRVDGHYEMRLPSNGDQVAATTLADLGVCPLPEFRRQITAAAERGPGSKEYAESLRRLDAFGEELLRQVGQLLKRGCGVGLLRPPSILVRETHGQTQVLLPDLGFLVPGDHWGSTPAWFEETNKAVKEWRELWDRGDLKTLQKLGDPATFGRSPAPGQTESALRVLARTFAWLLLGKVSRKIPTRDDEPSTHAPVWNVLTDAETGRITTIEEFREKLQDSPLSGHFRPEPVQAGKQFRGVLGLPWPGRRPALAGAALMLALVAFVGGGYWGYWELWGKGKTSDTNSSVVIPPPPDLPALPPDSRMVVVLAEFQNAAQPEDQHKALLKLYETRPARNAATRQLEAQHRARARYEFVERQLARFDRIRQTEEVEVYRLPELVQEAEQIRDLLTALRTRSENHEDLQAREKLCLNTCEEWLAQKKAVYGGE